MSSSDSDSSTEKSKKKQKKKKVIPVMDMIKKVKPKHKDIVINLSMTRYEVLTDVAEQLDWHIQYTSKKGDWDVLWTDQMVEPDTLIKMHFFQKISHFPGIHVLARKNLLGMSFMEMKKTFPQAYYFVPDTWMLPKDYADFRQTIQKCQKEQNQQKCFIVKPEADCQGRGIFLTFNKEEVQNGKHYVIQQYIERPFIVQGLKFDFRVYALLCGSNPMRLYVYEQGLARFATQKYQYPNRKNVAKAYMHLTNYAINKRNPKYVYNSSVNNMSSGHKRTLTSIFVNMKRRGLNVDSLKEKIDDVITKTILMGMPLVSHQYKFCQPDDQYRNMCFHILGIDVMIDQMLNPIVLQVNHTPSFATDTPLDYYIKFNLIKDTLVLLNINEKTKKQLVKKTNSYRRQRVTNAKRLIQTEEHRQRIKQCQKKRDQYQNQNLGKYRKVYPVQNQQKMKQYEQYLQYAQKLYFTQNNWIRAQLDAQKQKQKKKNKSFVEKRQKSVELPIRVPIKHQYSYNQKPKSEMINSPKLSPQIFREQLKDKFKQQTKSQLFPDCFDKNQYESCNTNDLFSPLRNSPFKKKAHQSAKQVKQEKTIKNKNQLDELLDRRFLPKIQPNQISPSKSIPINSRKNKYQSLKKRMLGLKEFEKSRNIGKSFSEEMSSAGSFLKPKLVNFQISKDQIVDL